ncbi:Putative beta-barrel porin 2 [Devosia enhydra]|uniref:Putative beta-barrel porin 2 n=1 Tax=Devosia enhydra TaxID=665118 RepID=A0A1K2I2N7_9HYPH|nr:outer membrane beta-barrel protein [Devosia enhydra]SFZ86646.1 Putative beta-barrel porin 2 [Devosia enhydra]
MPAFSAPMSTAGLFLLLTLAAVPVAQAQGFGDGSATSNPDLLAPGSCIACASDVAPLEAGPAYTYWSLGLRGAYVVDNQGSSFETLVLPSVGMGMEGGRRSYTLGAGAELSKATDEPARINYLWGAVDGTYKLDSLTRFEGGLDLNVGQSSINEPWQQDDVANASVEIALDGEGAIIRDLGRFTLTARGTGGRSVYGPNGLSDGSSLSMDHKNNWRAGGGLRLGYALTPIIGVFGDVSGSRQMFDTPSPTLGVRQDNDTYVAKAGVTANWENHLEIEYAVGLGLRRFTDESLSDVASTQYEARLTYTPNVLTTVTAEAYFGLGDETVTSAETTPIEANLLVGVAHTLNPTLTLRGSARYDWEQKVGGTEPDSEYALGVGADYIVNPRTTITADYTYINGIRGLNPPDVEHRAVVGLTFTK